MYWTSNWLVSWSPWSYSGTQQDHEAWGDRRIPIEPGGGTNLHGRNPKGFYLHGGRYIGSAGCIDIGRNDIDIIDDIWKHNGKITLIVDYSQWSGKVTGTRKPYKPVEWWKWKWE
jgi:hypothetical protein